MNTHHTLQPERWLLAVSDLAQAQAIQQALASQADAQGLSGWRLRHGLVHFVGEDKLPDALREALDEGCPAVHLHTTLAEDALAGALLAARLAAQENRLVDLSHWDADAAELLPCLQAELARPDAWVEVAWRLNNGASFPALAVPGQPGSQASYREAFKLWRAERLRLGDSGASPFEDEDDVPYTEPIDEAHESLADIEDDAGLFEPGDRPMFGYGQAVPVVPPGRPATGGMMHASPGGADVRWLDVTTWQGHTLAAGGGGKWAFTLRLQRLVMSAEGPWLGAQIVIEWDPDIAAQAVRHSHRICLLPRLQKPVLLTLEAGSTKAQVKGIPQSRLSTWPQALEGTPLTLLVLP